MTRRILLVSPFAPAREGRHGSVRAVHGLATELAARHEVVLLHLGAERDVDPGLAARCDAVHAVEVPARGPWSRRLATGVALSRGRSLWAAELEVPQLRRQLSDLVRRHRPDVVQIEHAILGELLAAATPEPLRIVTIYDPAASRRESVPLQREGAALMHRLDARAVVRQERRILALADAAVVFTERDRAVLAPSVPAGTELVTIPLGWTVPAQPLEPAGVGPPTLLFVGNFMHPPNVDAALRLARRIFPLVRAAVPDVTLELVGPSPPPELRAVASDSIRVTGAVPSMVPHLDRAAVVVTPIAIGGGMRVKVLEALAFGKAVVASTRAAEGITARSGDELIVVDGDAETASAVAGLLADEDARRRLAARARGWALRELTWSAMADRYDDLYDRLERHRNGSMAER